MNTKKIQEAVKMIIDAVGEDGSREGLQKTSNPGALDSGNRGCLDGVSGSAGSPCLGRGRAHVYEHAWSAETRNGYCDDSGAWLVRDR